MLYFPKPSGVRASGPANAASVAWENDGIFGVPHETH